MEDVLRAVLLPYVVGSPMLVHFYLMAALLMHNQVMQAEQRTATQHADHYTISPCPYLPMELCMRSCTICNNCAFVCMFCSAAGGVTASKHVRELHTLQEFDDFVKGQEDRVLTVVDVSVSGAAPCIQIFPAVLALARSFQGYAAFGRYVEDVCAQGA